MRTRAQTFLLSCIWLVFIPLGASLRVAPPTHSLRREVRRTPYALPTHSHQVESPARINAQVDRRAYEVELSTVHAKLAAAEAGKATAALLEVESPARKNAQADRRACEIELSTLRAKLVAAEATAEASLASVTNELRESQDELVTLRTLIEGLQEDCKCVITQDALQNPVVMSDGHTYEQGAIRRWVAEKETSPLTGLPLRSAEMTPNLLVKKLARALHGTIPKSSFQTGLEALGENARHSQVALHQEHPVASIVFDFLTWFVLLCPVWIAAVFYFSGVLHTS